MSNTYIAYLPILEKYGFSWYNAGMGGGNVMELRVLKYFLAVAREESISRAA